MNPSATIAPGLRHTRRIRIVGILVLMALVLLNLLATALIERLQNAWFDSYQELSPRRVKSMPATVVEIDEKSLAAYGQWPWPRTLLAQLVAAVESAQPAAIGIDILMSEADALSPERLLTPALHPDAAVIGALRGLPSNDAELARTLTDDHVVLAIAGTKEPSTMLLRAPPFGVRNAAETSTPSAGIAPSTQSLAHYAGVRTSIDTLDRAAFGHGLISVEPAGGVIRRIPLVADIGGTLAPSLAIEMLRVALHASSLRLLVADSSVQGIAIGAGLVVPTENDGAALVYFSPRNAGRFVSAVDVLQGNVDPGRFNQKLVLIGVTGLGLIEHQSTPLGERMPGSEIHAQLLENLYDQTLLHRPAWARLVELLTLTVLGALLIWATPRWKPQYAGLLLLAGVALPVVAAFFAFRSQRLLFDALSPGLSLMLLFGALLLLTLGEAARERKSLEGLVQRQREQSARVAGELQAAQRIQIATLPREDSLRDDPRIDLAASMVPAREVGGDLYDFFRLDARRLFFLVGDVSGKGLPSSIFMAVSKALYKSTTLRSSDGDIGDLMSAANIEVSRDNREMLFVTAFVGILDLDSGDLDYCNAGHENPYLLHSSDKDGGKGRGEGGGTGLRRIEDGGGPPLCAVTDFVYRGGHCVLSPGDTLCLISDGVTEAQNARGEFYGAARVQTVLSRFDGGAGPGADANADANADATHAVLNALRSDVDKFTAGAEAADDITILVLRWLGPQAG